MTKLHQTDWSRFDLIGLGTMFHAVPSLALAQTASVMFLLLAVAVSLVAVFFQRHGNSRPPLRLPLHPAVPAASAAIDRSRRAVATPPASAASPAATRAAGP